MINSIDDINNFFEFKTATVLRDKKEKTDNTERRNKICLSVRLLFFWTNRNPWSIAMNPMIKNANAKSESLSCRNAIKIKTIKKISPNVFFELT